MILAAPSSGSGKTLVTSAILAALRKRGQAVTPFKVGPDYIDPGYLALAAERNCCNLDPWAMRPRSRAALLASSEGLALIEGVMGLFDGARDGSASTADLAVELGLPVVLVVNARGMAHSAGALLHGYGSWRNDLPLAGVIFTRVGSSAHYELLTRNLSVPALGYLLEDRRFALPSRHLGLVLASEQGEHLDLMLGQLANAAEAQLDLDRLLELARPLPQPEASLLAQPAVAPLGKVIAVARDEAFAFAYPHLLLGWQQAGSTLRFFAPLDDEGPDPAADAVFLPGGYPELYARELAAAEQFRAGMRAAAARELPIYGECGGYMVLGKRLIDASGDAHDMLGLLPVETSFAQPKRRLGYRHIELKRDCLLGKRGERFRGHEYHMTAAISELADGQPFRAWSSDGDDLGPMGAMRGSVLGSYLHLIDRE